MPNLKGFFLLLYATIAFTPTAFAAHHSSGPDETALSPIEKAAEYPLLLRRTTLIVRDIEASLAVPAYFEAPIEKGEVVGSIALSLAGEMIYEGDVVAQMTVEESGILSRLGDYIYLMFE